MVSLNRHHLAAGPLIDLVAMRKRLVNHLTQELASWTNLAGAWLFGSTARGEGGRDSDIDILLVTDTALDDQDWVEATDQLREHVRAWTGNEPQLVEHSRQSFLQPGTTEPSRTSSHPTEPYSVAHPDNKNPRNNLRVVLKVISGVSERNGLQNRPKAIAQNG